MNGGKWGIGQGWNQKTELIFSWSVPAGVAPSGSMGNNGALTLGTALDQIYSDGVWLWLPANAISAGSAAGCYWCIMSSTTIGTVYNTVLGSKIPYKPDYNVAFSTTGPGAYTGLITESAVATITMPGGTLGLQGRVSGHILSSHNNSAGAKKWYLRGGSTELRSQSSTTSVASSMQFMFVASNSSQKITGPSTNTMSASAVNVNDVITLDHSADVVLTFNVDTATATDWQIINAVQMSVIV
jgi:hypothetical protein